MKRITDDLREQVTKRARGLCEYCQSAERIGISVEVDHIIPVSAGGETHLDNLCLTCRRCNGSKQDFQTGLDPDTEQELPLFNPRTQHWDDHFKWNDDGTLMIGLTPIGRATIVRLRINRESIIPSRRLWVQVGWHPPREGRFPLDNPVDS
jgi:hypothetical protein